MKNRKRALAVLVKVPRSGEVKKRLAEELNPDDVLDLYRAFVVDTLSVCWKVNEAQLVVGFFPGELRNEIVTFVESELANSVKHQKKLSAGSVIFCEQKGDNLGERLQNLFDQLFQLGYTTVVIIGVDSPTVSPRTIRQAFALLKRKPVVLGPTLDGGYYIIGMVKPTPELFKDIEWDTGRVYRETVEKLKTLQMEWEELNLWYDVDTVDDLEFLVRDINQLRRAGDEISLKKTEEVLERILRSPNKG